MVLLALERSTRLGSIAIFQEGVCTLSQSAPVWAGHGTPPLTAHRSLLTVSIEGGVDVSTSVTEALSSLRLAPLDVTHCAVGLGPGSFAGIRSALAFLEGFCAPRQLPILGVSSAAAIAHDVGGDAIVLGDARRGQYWVYAKGEMQLVPYAEFCVEPTRKLFSPDAERIQYGGVHHAIPTAKAVGELALNPDTPKIHPPLPLYLHSAV